MKESVTVTLSKQPDSPFITFKQFDIIKTNNHPVFGTCWNVVTTDTESMKIDDSYKVSIQMRKLNTSKWWFIRNIELKIIKKLLK